jgi:hypothetical protein
MMGLPAAGAGADRAAISPTPRARVQHDHQIAGDATRSDVAGDLYGLQAR